MALHRACMSRHASRFLSSTWSNKATCIPRLPCHYSKITPSVTVRGITITPSETKASEKFGGPGVAYDNAHLEARRRFLNRILYRSRQRGFLELDLLLGKWAEDNIQNLQEKQLEALVQVLDVENPDLWKWLTGQDGAPENLTNNVVFQAIKKQVSENLLRHAAPETRANPGQPWVRGWDEFRKVGGPQIGNQ